MSSPAPDPQPPVLLTGATGVVGPFLVERLLASGHPVHAISRRFAPVERPGLTWERADLARRTYDVGPSRVSTWIHAAPLWLAPLLVPGLASRGLRRLIAFGSTSRFTKARSPQARERELAARLARAESALAEACDARGIAWTIFRPTLVWGGARDRNVSSLARLRRCLGFIPLAGAACGGRQPVHGADLAQACLAVLDNARTFRKAYDLPGAETMTFGEMAARVARGMGLRPRLVHFPRPALRIGLNVARLLPGLGHLSPQMADRMNEDLVFDSGSARADFGYSPGLFVFPDGDTE